MRHGLPVVTKLNGEWVLRISHRLGEGAGGQILLKWLQADFIYAISDSTWVSPFHVVPKKSRITMVKNEKGEEMPTIIV